MEEIFDFLKKNIKVILIIIVLIIILGCNCSCKSIEGFKQPLKKIPDAAKCKGYYCSINGQFCPPNRAGSKHPGYCCINRRWKNEKCPPPGTIRPADKCRGNICTINGQFCPPNRWGSGGVGYCCEGRRWKPGNWCSVQEAQKILNGTKKATTAEVFEAGKTLSKKECDLCLGIMTALEPSIIIAYKVFVQSANLTSIITSLLGHLVGGTAKAGAVDNTFGLDSENNIRKTFVYRDIKIWIQQNTGIRDVLVKIGNTKDTDLITVRLIQALAASITCLGANFTISNIRNKITQIKNLKMDIIHGFIRCLIINFARFVVMALTKCGQIDKCTPTTKVYQVLENLTDSYLKGEQEMLQMTTEAESKSLNKMRNSEGTFIGRIGKAFGLR